MASWKDLPDSQRKPAAVALAVSVAVVFAAEFDLRRRPAEMVRGPKLLWRVLCTNALGALGYFRWGRRPALPAGQD
jgi:hypothetical protein